MRPEVRGKTTDLMSNVRGDDNNFIESPDGRPTGKRNVMTSPVDGDGGTPAMRGVRTGPVNADKSKVGGNAIENHVGAKPLKGGRASRTLKPGHSTSKFK